MAEKEAYKVIMDFSLKSEDTGVTSLKCLREIKYQPVPRQTYVPVQWHNKDIRHGKTESSFMIHSAGIGEHISARWRQAVWRFCKSRWSILGSFASLPQSTLSICNRNVFCSTHCMYWGWWRTSFYKGKLTFWEWTVDWVLSKIMLRSVCNCRQNILQ